MEQCVLFYHANCEDGLASATAAVLSGKVRESETCPISYGSSEYLTILNFLKLAAMSVELKGPISRIYFVDFCPSPETYEKLYQSFPNKIVIIDHHKTAIEKFKESSVVFREQDEFIFDLSKSGSMLTWEYFNPYVTIPVYIRLVNDRDLWRLEDSRSLDFNAGLKFLEPTIENRLSLIADSNKVSKLVERGREYSAILDREYRKHILENGRLGWVSTQEDPETLIECVCVNAPLQWATSIGALILEHSEPRHDLVCTYQIVHPLEVNLSFRSSSKVDCSRIAKAFGGGGHSKAAGAQINLEYFLRHFKFTYTSPKLAGGSS